MIIELDLFNSLSYGSGKKVLCKCDKCGTENKIIKQSILKQKGNTYTLCRKCRTKETGIMNTGIVRSEEHKRKTGIASKGRKPSQLHIDIARKRLTGETNPKWNPDRVAVQLNKKAQKECSQLIHSTLKRTTLKKINKSEIMLGYSKKQLLIHIESLFLEGMSWENRSLWHIDHKKSIKDFLKEGITDPKIINALSNLQPLWAKDNLSKGAKSII